MQQSGHPSAINCQRFTLVQVKGQYESQRSEEEMTQKSMNTDIEVTDWTLAFWLL